jgi:hypothetical protein
MAGCGARNPHAGHVNESNKVFDIESFMVSTEEFDLYAHDTNIEYMQHLVLKPKAVTADTSC